MNLNAAVNKVLTLSARPIFLMMVGVPGSGKSTFISKLNEASNGEFKVASTDDMVEAFAKEKGWTYSQAFGEVNFKKLQREMQENVTAWVKARQSFIWDQTNVVRSARGKKLALVPADWVRIAVTFDQPEKVLFERLEKRGRETGKVIDKGIVMHFFKQYQTPTKDEGFNLILEVQNG